MVPPDETSPDQIDETSPETGGRGPSPEGESNDQAAESLSQEQIQRWRALEERAKEQNVDFEQLLPEFTRTRQQLKELETENAGWRESFQQIHRAQQQSQMQADPEAVLTQQIVEAESNMDYEKAAQLRSHLVSVQTRKIAREEFQNLNQTQQQAQLRQALLDRAKSYGIESEREFDRLVVEAAQDPEALSMAVAWKRNPEAVRESILKDVREREARAEAAGRSGSIANTGGRRVPGSLDREDERPVVPASVYYGFPESVAQKKWPNAIIVQGDLAKGL